eukprot:jgi/Botrbrau1/16409/Bobra.0142s0009.1
MVSQITVLACMMWYRFSHWTRLCKNKPRKVVVSKKPGGTGRLSWDDLPRDLQSKIIELLPIDVLQRTACLSKAFHYRFLDQLDLISSRLTSFSEDAPASAPLYEEAIPDASAIGLPPATLVKGLLTAWDMTCKTLSRPQFMPGGNKSRHVMDMHGNVDVAGRKGTITVTGQLVTSWRSGALRVDWCLCVTLWWRPPSLQDSRHEAMHQATNGVRSQVVQMCFKGQATRMIGGRPCADLNIRVRVYCGERPRRLMWLSVLLLLSTRLRASMQLLACSLNSVPLLPSRDGLPLIQQHRKPVVMKGPIRVSLEMDERSWDKVAPLLSFAVPVMLHALRKQGMRLGRSVYDCFARYGEDQEPEAASRIEKRLRDGLRQRDSRMVAGALEVLTIMRRSRNPFQSQVGLPD